MDDQRCSLPQNKPTQNRLSLKKDEGAQHSASFSTQSDMRLRKKEKVSPIEVYYSATLLKGLH